jgi:hypothetical protein
MKASALENSPLESSGALMSRISCIVSICAVFCLSACSSVPLSSIPALSRIDFRMTDFAALRAGLRLPDFLRPQPEGVELEVILRMDGASDDKTVFKLLDVPTVALPDGDQSGKKDFGYRLSDQDAARFDAIREKTTVARQQGKRGSVVLSISPRQFCLLQPLPDGPVLATTYILTSETKRFVALTRDVDLRLEPETASALQNLKSCKNG